MDDTTGTHIPRDDLIARLAESDDSAEQQVAEILDAAHWDVGAAKAERLAFEQRLHLRWELPLEMLEREYLYLMECGRWFESEDWPETDSSTPAKLHAVSLLARRANKATSEMLALLRSGHADGALARCRTLWKLAVVAIALQTHDDVLRDARELCGSLAFLRDPLRVVSVPVAPDHAIDLEPVRQPVETGDHGQQ
jgi:hypothetical protein